MTPAFFFGSEEEYDRRGNQAFPWEKAWIIIGGNVHRLVSTNSWQGTQRALLLAVALAQKPMALKPEE